MAEVIGLVADLDKDRPLKTDLLGDAIESALSETGGTKDIGLHRTPDHIRQFMVALIAPTFGGLLFDPTVGIVRKTAAINFYVRGLNLGNIQQGDTLQKFGGDILPESKTGIVANPPFGAERDQAAYPNVWKEHMAESETTILFVKLMVETLKRHGRCAVIVSEGFLTWDRNSARVLRRALLDECNLQAIISLPQGVFVSKGG